MEARDTAVDNGNKQGNGGALTRDYSRASKIRFDESDLIAQLMESHKETAVLIDVGAHVGSAMAPFLEKGWKIFAFEPDEKNRQILESRYGNHPNVTIDKRAVSDRPAENVQFYSSKESSGISSLASFHRSHETAGYVNVTTLAKYCEEQGIDHIDFLLIDAEGYDLFVLQGIDWTNINPEIIVCEFEDRKTKSLGYTIHDLAMFLKDKGYEVLVSEWHPILSYGIAHDWRRLARYPCENLNPDAWGNLIAFRNSPDWQKLLSIAARQTMPSSGAKNVLLKIIKALWRRRKSLLLKSDCY